MKNLVLIGMPGCGKTSVGTALSQMLNMPLVDTDRLVEEAAGRSISDIFAQDGEAVFRELEAAAARRAAAMKGAIIATGGGMVLREENMTALAASGIIFFRDRALEDIISEDHNGRPLIGEDKSRIHQLYEQRITYYQTYAQHRISHTDTVEEAARIIADIFRKECGT